MCACGRVSFCPIMQIHVPMTTIEKQLFYHCRIPLVLPLHIHIHEQFFESLQVFFLVCFLFYRLTIVLSSSLLIFFSPLCSPFCCIFSALYFLVVKFCLIIFYNLWVLLILFFFSHFNLLTICSFLLEHFCYG